MKSDVRTIQGKVIAKHYEESRHESGYHYAYSAMDGKMKLTHYDRTIPEKHIVTITFLNDTIIQDSKSLYNKDYVIISYKRVYYDKVFRHNSIVKIE